MTLRVKSISIVLTALVLLTGCIVSDDVISAYISRKGAVRLILFKDNIHSDKKGVEKRDEETKWLVEFKGDQLSELKKLRESGAKDIKTVLVKEGGPYSVVISANYDSIRQFGTFYDFNGKTSSNKMELISKANKRRLVFRFSEKERKEKEHKGKALEENGNHVGPYPIFRFVIEEGRITESKGFQMSNDKQSCLLDIKEVDRLFHENKDFEIFVSWEYAAQ